MMAEIHEDFGPLYQFSDHKKGDRITYRVDGRTETGEIVWVSVGSQLPSGRNMPPCYVVDPDRGGFPDMVLFGDVVMGEAPDMEPTMQKCPYCMGSHYTADIEKCPLKPRH